MKIRYLVAATLCWTAACGGDFGSGEDDGYYASDAGAGSTPECFSSNECPTGWTCAEFGTCVPPAPGAPDGGPGGVEVEVELSPPSHSERYVYVAMTELDALAKIDGSTLSVTSIPVGDQPEVLEAIPSEDGVVVLDRNNGTASIVRATATGDDSRVVPVLPNMNRISIDPTGTYALAWFDLRQETLNNGGLGGVGAIGSFQDVTVIRLSQDGERSVDLSVGFRPRDVQFDEGGSRAFVITDDGISVIDLAESVEAGPSIVAPIDVASGPGVDPLDTEVNVTASGEFAVIRETDSADVRVIDLSLDQAGATAVISLPASPSDLDLASNGRAAYAVLKDTSELAILDLTDGLPTGDDVRLVELGGENVGSIVLSPAGDQAVLFTNASSVERLTVVDLDDGLAVRSFGLQKSIRSLGYDPTGESLIVTHAKSFGSPQENGITFDEFIDRSFGYSIVDIATGFDKLQITGADPGAFQFSTTTPRAYVLVDGGDGVGALAQTHVIELDTGVVRLQSMSSPPETVGILPEAGVAFVNQRHPLGRVSFINVVTDAMRTVTGFDLNSRIVD
ncbi:MAG: hypothetical protein GY811_15745 [Myxococcales bacterium]|nr:hypothetical protein [Myxococcales bacterium]